MEILNFIFQDFLHFIGCTFLIFAVGGVLANIFKNIRLFEIKQVNPMQTPQQNVNQSVFNDLVKLWNNRNKGTDDKK